MIFGVGRTSGGIEELLCEIKTSNQQRRVGDARSRWFRIHRPTDQSISREGEKIIIIGLWSSQGSLFSPKFRIRKKHVRGSLCACCNFGPPPRNIGTYVHSATDEPSTISLVALAPLLALYLRVLPSKCTLWNTKFPSTVFYCLSIFHL